MRTNRLAGACGARVITGFGTAWDPVPYDRLLVQLEKREKELDGFTLLATVTAAQLDGLKALRKRKWTQVGEWFNPNTHNQCFMFMYGGAKDREACDAARERLFHL